MNLSTHYDNLYKDSLEKIKKDQYKIDTKIASWSDDRFGITLLIRPPQKVKNEFRLFLDELKKHNSNQYFYPDSDIHVTVLSIISCYSGFNIKQIEIENYIERIKNTLLSFENFEIEFKGITASDSAILIQGFPTNETLNTLRDAIRKAFSISDLEQTIDKRYQLFTAHTTVCRFSEKIQNTEKLLETISKFKTYSFGSFKIENMELVSNDWYHKQEKTEHLYNFKF